MFKFSAFVFLLTLSSSFVFAQSAVSGLPGRVGSTPHVGPNITIEALFYNYPPTGVTISKFGRKFINFNRPANYTVVELVNGKEVPFPNLAINSPPSLQNASNPAYASNYVNYLLSVQNVVSEYHCTSHSFEDCLIPSQLMQRIDFGLLIPVGLPLEGECSSTMVVASLCALISSPSLPPLSRLSSSPSMLHIRKHS
jgi:hypothetical protein